MLWDEFSNKVLNLYHLEGFKIYEIARCLNVPMDDVLLVLEKDAEKWD